MSCLITHFLDYALKLQNVFVQIRILNGIQNKKYLIYISLFDDTYYTIRMNFIMQKDLRLLNASWKTTILQPADCKSSFKYFKICKWGFSCNAKWTS